MAQLSTPDLYDKYANQIQVADAGLLHFGEVPNFNGEAVTVCCPDDNSIVGEKVRQPGNGKVLVIDAGGSRKFAFLGDMLAEHAVKNGWAGIIVNGCVRDVEILKTLPLPVMALGSTPRKTVKSGLGGEVEAVSFLSVRIKKGDWLYGDENGLIISTVKLES